MYLYCSGFFKKPDLNFYKSYMAYVTYFYSSLYAGVLALGVGDSLAALVGSKWGTRVWPGK